ncbi:MAG: CNNM domain-containing protein, partial [Acidimicrobiia bacterium]
MTAALLALVGVVALLAAHAFFVGGEFGLLAVDRSEIARLASGGDRRAAGVVKSLRHLSFLLSAAQLG